MYSIVKRLRVDGARKSDHDIAADPGVLGHLSLVNVAGVNELKVHAAGDDSVRTPMIPILYGARVTTMHGNKVLWEGEEREGDNPKGRTVKQEWSVLMGVEPPAEVPQPTVRIDG